MTKKNIFLYTSLVTLVALVTFKVVLAQPVKPPPTVGIVIIETGAEDGVWLESIKMIHILKRLGIDVKVMTGLHFGSLYDETGNPIKGNRLTGDYYIKIPGEKTKAPKILQKVYIDPKLTPRHPIASEIFDKNFEEVHPKTGKIRPKHVSSIQQRQMARQIDDFNSEIFRSISDWVKREDIRLIISQNANAIPIHLALGVALRRVIDQLKLPAIFHNHDFFWERGKRYLGSPYPYVRRLLKDFFPGVTPSHVEHMVINDHNLNILKERFDLKAKKIVNVMNFEDSDFAKEDEYNRTLWFDFKKLFKKNTGVELPENALLLGQVTRVVRRKNIEASIQLLEHLNDLRGDQRVILVVTGTESPGDKTQYKDKLVQLIQRKNLESQVAWISEIIGPHRRVMNDGRKIYSLSDFYSLINKRGIMTYPSTYEGFGNALVEALLAKVFIVVNRYKPVYDQEIGSKLLDGKKLQIVEYDDGIIDQEMAKKVNRYLTDLTNSKESTKTKVEHNFKLGKKYFSYPVAEKVIRQTLEKFPEFKSYIRKKLSSLKSSRQQVTFKSRCSRILKN